MVVTKSEHGVRMERSAQVCGRGARVGGCATDVTDGGQHHRARRHRRYRWKRSGGRGGVRGGFADEEDNDNGEDHEQGHADRDASLRSHLNSEPTQRRQGRHRRNLEADRPRAI